MNVDIIEYEDDHHEAFRSMNEAWLDLYNLKEEADMLILNNPRKTIIDNGGVIFLARCNNEIVGSAALIKTQDGTFELAKMAVVNNYRKQGIGQLLIKTCLDKAKDLNAHKILLFSNHQLKAALALYEKYGFTYVPVKDSHFATADIKMELTLR